MTSLLASRFGAINHCEPLLSPIIFGGTARNLASKRRVSMCTEDSEIRCLMEYLESLKNYERSGVPKGAGTDSVEGFDLGRMRRLMHRLGNPQSNLKAVHVAGTKGKGSAAAYVSNILRAGGYSVGCYTSPHLWSIRERMSVGRLEEPVSAKKLNNFFLKIKPILDQAIEEEIFLSHFEVLTGLAFALFANDNVDIAVIEAGLGGARDATNVIDSSGLAVSVITTIGEEHMAALGGSLESIAMAKSGIIKQGRPVVLGGPFLPHIEGILRCKASSMSAPVISASGAGVNTLTKGVGTFNGRLCQSCDIVIRIERDMKLIMELTDINLRMLGHHQLQNAVTAACVALCLRNQGWKLSDEAIRSGLENACLLGRSQFLTSEEADAMGLPGATVLLDGAHTKESARALRDMIQMTFPDKKLAFVVAMANDKDHLAFAKELLSGKQPEAVVLTDADIAGGKVRTTSPSSLRDSWIKAANELGIDTVVLNEEMVCASGELKNTTILAAEDSFEVSAKLANQILGERREDDGSGIIVVTGSLHIVSHILASVQS